MANIGLVGYGVVGKAVGDAFQETIPTNKILFYDKFKKSNTLEEVVSQSDVTFVCVPTPYNNSTRRFDSNCVDDAMFNINSVYTDNKPLIVIKSTVIPGTTMRYIGEYPKMNICFNPEFLTEKSPKDDFINAERQLIGAENIKSAAYLTQLYLDNFFNVPVYIGNPTEIELIKYITNAFLATKVTFANEIYDLCKVLGLNYANVKQLFVQDKRIGETHLDVTPERGFGGKCLPKDTMSLVGLMEDLGVDSKLLDAVLDKNNKIRKVYDWEDIPGAMTHLES
ncbi:MAG: hypothetical protein AABW84_02020 [Nanoarchaeota archaeon]